MSDEQDNEIDGRSGDVSGRDLTKWITAPSLHVEVAPAALLMQEARAAAEEKNMRTGRGRLPSVCHRLLLVVLATLGTPMARSAQAQAPQSEPPAYRPLVEEAVRELESNNFAEARSLFAKASAIYPSARALRGVGMAEFELRHYGDSATSLERALSSTVQPLTGELRAEAERLLARARGFVARITLTIKPADAKLAVDGSSIAGAPPAALVLEVGDHNLEFRAAGYAPETKLLKVLGGEELALNIALEPEHARPLNLSETARQPSKDSDPRRPLYKNPWLWAGVGVVVAGAATGLAIGLTRDKGGVDSPYDGANRIPGP